MITSTDPQQSDTGATAPRRRRRPPAWLVGAGLALAAIAAVTFLRGEDAPAAKRDLSTPEGAARAFAGAAAAGDVEGVLAITCLGSAGCTAEHGGGVTPEQVAAAEKVIAKNVREIGGRFGNAEFTASRAGTEPGTREVDYRLPGMPEGERNYLVFVEYQNRWLYIATGGPAA